MAIYSGFFGSENEFLYTQPQFAAVFAKLFSNGVTLDFEDEFDVVENDPVSLSVVVPSGWAWIEGFWIYNTEDVIKTLAAADPDNDRIDRIVLRLDRTTEFEISIEVLEGTPAADPDPPELTQTSDIYEILLKQVLVAEDATSVADEDITDEREFVVVPNTVDLVSAQTLTNKRNTKRAYSTTTLATLTPEIDTYDMFSLTAQDQALDIANHVTSTPTAGECILIDITPDATPRDLTYGTNYVAYSGVAKPTTTVASKRMQLLFIWLPVGKYTLAWVGDEA